MPRSLPRNLSPWIPCPLPGYEGLEARFVVSRSKGQVDACADQSNALAALLVGAVQGWDFTGPLPTPLPTEGDEPPEWGWEEGPLPAPVPEVAETFNVCPLDLLVWFCKDGFQAGMQAVISPPN